MDSIPQPVYLKVTGKKKYTGYKPRTVISRHRKPMLFQNQIGKIPTGILTTCEEHQSVMFVYIYHILLSPKQKINTKVLGKKN